MANKWPANCINIARHVALLDGSTVHSLYCGPTVHSYTVATACHFFKGDHIMNRLSHRDQEKLKAMTNLEFDDIPFKKLSVGHLLVKKNK